ncbi:MAG: YdcF family protein [Tatlockia sp.]|nr:YdcF family protein [Tatlockia sp.]
MTEVTEFAKKLWDYHFLNQKVLKADCIIGLGSYDLRVAEKCAQLYLSNYAPLVIFSGMHGNWTKTLWNKTEAEIFAEHAVKNGLPRKVIKLESKSTNIGENALFTKQLLIEENTKTTNIIVVTKPNTQRRAYATFRKLWPEVNVMVTSLDLPFENHISQYVKEEIIINEMVGDLHRIKIYPKLGYQINQDIPDDIEMAYQKLISLGYTHHLLSETHEI